MAGYTHDVFLSYSRKNAWPDYIEKNFRPIFEHWMGAELGRDVRLYQDKTGLSTGQRWRDALRDAIAGSRVMVALWTKEYFASEACTWELSLMLARADDFRARNNPAQLVLPVELHDGEAFPEFLREIQSLKLQDYSSPFMQPGGAQRETLSERLKVFARDVGVALSQVPDESFAWPRESPNIYETLLAPHVPQQLTVPSLGGA
jgi:hypothetical protein